MLRPSLNSLKAHWKDSPTFWIFVIFFCVNLFCYQKAGGNPFARVATMIGIVEQGSYRIDAYKEWTADWAKAPDGHYYSNKAPGTMFLGAPFYAVIDYFLVSGLSPEEKIQRRGKSHWIPSSILSILLQVIPTILIALWALKYLKSQGYGGQASMLFLITYFFANTVSLKMNTYFGHAFSAWVALATLLAWLESRWFLVGLFSGISLLCDYSGLFIVLNALILPLLFKELSLKGFARILLGASLPALLWIHYHTTAFGSPLAIANKFQNPSHVDMASESDNLMGVIGLFPRWEYLKGLLWSSNRGLLTTQAWLVISLFASGLLILLKKVTARNPLKIYCFAISTFLMLLYMNGSFKSWHGGTTCGPRYLSNGFSLVCFSFPFFWSHYSRWVKRLLFCGIVLSCLLYILIMSTTITALYEPLWEYYFRISFLEPFAPYTKDRLIGLFLVFAWGLRRYYKLWKAHEMLVRH